MPSKAPQHKMEVISLFLSDVPKHALLRRLCRSCCSWQASSWNEMKWIWRFSCAHREIMWTVGITPRILISVLCGDAPGALRSGVRSRYPWNRKLSGNHRRSARFGDEGNFMGKRTTIPRLLRLLVQTQYWLLCYGSGCCPFWESSYFARVCFSRVIVFMICKLTL